MTLLGGRLIFRSQMAPKPRPHVLTGKNHLFLEQAEGYGKAPQKSTSRVLNWREVFEHCTQNDEAGGKRLNVVLKVLSVVQSGDSKTGIC